MKNILSTRSIVILFITIITTLTLAACSKGDKEQGKGAENKNNKATEITVLLPSEIPADMLAEFEDETGIHVNLETSSWNNIQDKIVSALAAGVAPADVTEFDWSWIGQFGSAEWYTPLNESFDQEFIDDMPTIENFKYNGDYLAVPYLNDFRVSYYNQNYFDEAGITEIPKTPEELLEVAKTIKEKGVVEYPIGLPLSATEGTTTGWFTLVKAFGGHLFDDNWNPLFVEKDSAGYQAMSFIINSYKEDELIDSANLTLNNIDVYDNFKAGGSAIDLAGVPGLFERYKNPEKSSIANDVEIMPVPGMNGEIHTFQLPEALGVPAASENKEAAIEFIKWISQPENVKKLYEEQEWLPNRLSVLEALNEEGKLSGGDTLLKVLTHDKPLFSEGTPPWYSEFSTNVSTTMNQMAKGALTIDEGMKKIAKSVEKYAE
ncbi:ABC transporter substrate-binding protein [Sporosarcina sp. 6E9]|uniref:ABC transporter substrate-binding protein n=1 Tax=Sporosarcina sp. 6E9 TaxID=2819235 RepID=UPI001B3028E1|nr:sugar ABC transporter substrate-binding protein [Sporosarcina sp. 6E9]